MEEKELDLAIAERLQSSDEFCRWLLERTGFAGVAEESRLLHREQIAARPHVDPRFWYRYWWCKLPDGKDSETDIFLLFARASVPERFAIHIENKPPRRQLRPDQEKNYPLRAAFMANILPITYSKWETVLLAPQVFWNKNSERCASFDRFISYEDAASFVPELGLALREAGTSAASGS